jgi:Na+/melibiose symporter-like transporter
VDQAATSFGVGFRSERGPVLIGVMLSTGLVAIDATIIATAVPSIVASLGGFAEFPWLFSVYLLAQAVTVPIYGKLADVFGRKPVMLFGIGLFLIGSIPLWPRVEHGRTHRVSRGPGPGRRRGPADVDDDRR